MKGPEGKGDSREGDDSDHSGDIVISWDGEDDPRNPLNWPDSVKWVHVAIISFGTFTM